MNTKCIIGVMFFLYSATLGANAQVTSSMNKVDGQLALSFELIKSKEKELQYTFELRNDGSKALFYSANPQQVDGVLTPYVSLDENDSSLVNIQWRVLDPNIVMSVENGGVNNTRIELKRLEPGKTVRDMVSIKWPLKETIPPLMDFRRQRVIERGNIKRIRFTMGYFEEEEGIVEFLTRKRFGWFITGNESLEVGTHQRKTFYEIQKLVSTEVSMPELK